MVERREIDLIKIKVSHELNSKAHRVYKIFKPKEIVQGEPFDIILTFKNIGEKFHGGFFDLEITQLALRVNVKQITVPPLEENKVFTVKVSDIALELTGICGIEFRNQKYYTADHETAGSIYLWSETGKLQHNEFLFLPISSKEEIYQKYSLVVALIALVVSLTALLLAATELIARIFIL
jgi:hypothetical protein